MELNSAINNITYNGIIEQEEATIQQSPEAFKILFDNLYTNKIMATVREIVCNALDAHHGAPDVHVPSHMAPTFSVRDYGPGLSHDNVMKLYMTIFSSTKRADNTKIGGFGLGSKAPFAYTDGFSVTSIVTNGVNNVKSSYALYRGDTGIPVISLVHKEETEDPTGLEVSVPVNASDIDAFSDAIHSVFRFVPACKIPANLNITPATFKYRDDIFGIKSDREWQVAFHVLVGTVAYPLNAHYEVNQHFTKLGLPIGLINNLKHQGIYLFFNPGEISIAPSREALSLDTRTLGAIGHSLDHVVRTLVNQVDDMLPTLKGNEWFIANKVQELDGIHNTLFSRGELHNVIPYSRTITNLVDQLYTENVRMPYGTCSIIANVGTRFVTTKTNLLQVNLQHFLQSKTHKLETKFTLSNTYLVWENSDNPQERNTQTKVRSYLKKDSHSYKHALVFCCSEDELPINLEALGIPLTEVNSYNDLPNATRDPKVVKGIDYLDLETHKLTRAKDWTQDKFRQGGHYLIYKNKLLTNDNGENLYGSGIRSMIHMLALREVVVVSGTQIDKFKDSKDWINVCEAAWNLANALATDPDVIDYAKLKNKISNSCMLDFMHTVLMENNDSFTSPIAAQVKEYASLKDSISVESNPTMHDKLKFVKLMATNKTLALSYEGSYEKHELVDKVNEVMPLVSFLNLIHSARYTEYPLRKATYDYIKEKDV